MITDINLFQFKRFKDDQNELFPLTLLTGINGVGKSSVLQSLLILRQSFDRGDLQNNKRLVIEDEIVNLISPDDMLYSGADSKKVSISLCDDNDNKATWAVVAEGESNSLLYTYEDESGNIYGCNLFNDSFQYLNAERIGPRPTYDRLRVRRKHSPIGYRGEFTANRILEALNKVEEVALSRLVIGNRSAKVYDQLSVWVSEIIYPGTKVEIDSSDSTQIKLKYSFAEEQTKAFNPVNVGFGFSFALPVILAVLTARSGSLLIIENPEAHLHPRGQSRMGMLLGLAAGCGVQIIVETHSEHILNGIRVLAKGNSGYGDFDSNLVKAYYFENTVSNGVVTNKRRISVLPNGKLSGWPAGFFDEWENNLRSLIR